MNKLERNIMAGVAVIYVVRKLTSRRAVECYALFLSAFGITLFVSLPHVAANFVHVESVGLPATGLYILSAVEKTNLIVQAALMLGVVAAFSLLRGVFRQGEPSRFA